VTRFGGVGLSTEVTTGCVEVAAGCPWFDGPVSKPVPTSEIADYNQLTRVVVISVIERQGQRVIINSDDPVPRYARKGCFCVGHLPVVRRDGAAEPRFAHSRSPCRGSSYRRRLHSVPHRNSDCPNNLLLPSMAAGRNSSKQDSYVTWLSLETIAGAGLLGILAYATVSFAIAHFRRLAQTPTALIDS